MKSLLTVFQLVFAIGLIATVLLQTRGAGLGNIFGGSSESYRSKRGAEKILFIITISFAVGFLLASILNVFAQ